LEIFSILAMVNWIQCCSNFNLLSLMLYFALPFHWSASFNSQALFLLFRKLKASNGSMSWKWSKQRRAATLRSKSFKCLFISTGKRLPWNWTLPPVEISFLLASGQNWASRSFNRLSGVTIQQVSIHCRSLALYRRREVRWRQQGIPGFISCVRNSRFESAWSGCY